MNKAFAALVLALATAGAGCDIVGAHVEATAQWQKTYSIPANGDVEIANVNGKIDVEPSSGNTVEITAIKKGRGVSDEAARAALERITIAENVTSSSVKLDTKYPATSSFLSGGGSVEYHVKVPAGATTKFSTVNGEVSVRGLSGRLNAETTNGEVRTRDVSGQLEASTTNGGLDIDLAKMPEGGVKLECTNGGIKVRLPRDAKASISASITNGGISAGDLQIDTSESTRRHLEGKMNGGGPRLAIDGTNGGISLTSR
jgi:hypothetical protein